MGLYGINIFCITMTDIIRVIIICKAFQCDFQCHILIVIIHSKQTSMMMAWRMQASLQNSYWLTANLKGLKSHFENMQIPNIIGKLYISQSSKWNHSCISIRISSLDITYFINVDKRGISKFASLTKCKFKSFNYSVVCCC